MDKYAKVSEDIAPKKLHLKNMNEKLKEAKASLKLTRDKLQVELDKVADLQARLQAAQNECQQLNEEV